MSFAQERLWFLDQLEPGLPVYNVADSYRIRGSLDVSALEQALTAVTARHEVLRTVYRNTGGTPMQEVQEPRPVAVTRHSLVGMELAEAEAVRLAREEARRPFQLDSDTMIRTLLIELAPADHLLIITAHHIASDGWSRGLFHRDLSESYAASLEGRQPDLKPLPIQYADYALWQREWLQGENLQRSLDYWRRALGGAPSFLELPASNRRPPMPLYRGDGVEFKLPAELTTQLRKLAISAATTPFVVCLASLKALLHRYTGEDDISVGTAVAGRTRLECEELIGCFVNMLVLRTDLSGDPSFRELLARVRIRVLEGIENQELPFEKLVEEINPEREMSWNPLFQVALSYRNVPRRNLVLPGAEVTHAEVQTGTAKFDWSFSVTEEPDGASCSLVFDTSIYDRDAMERTAAHWTTLLSGLAANPDLRLSELPVLTAEEKRRVVHLNNRTRRPYPQETVHELFARRAAEAPDAIAVETDTRRVTFRELEADCNVLAARLAELGAGPNQVVAIHSGRIPEMVAGLLAVLKTGSAYLPLDLNVPPQRTADLLQASAAVAVLVEEEREEQLPSLALPVVCLERCLRESSGSDSPPPALEVSLDAVACVLFTSGSTGKPKGARIPHRGILRLLFSAGEVEFNGDTVFLHIAPLAFDASTLEIWGGLLHGSRTVLHSDAVPTPESIGAAIRRHGVNTMWITASLFNLLVEEDVECLKPLRLLMTGGETLSVPHIRKALDALPDTQLVNGYGPTENTTFTTCYQIPKDLSDRPLAIPVGRPIGNTTVYVLDQYNNPTPEGVVGEICTGGDGLASGYLNAPELTAESFQWISIYGQDPTRLYRTGDFGRWNRSGLLEFSGRKDGQVKIRGFRIELGEVEAVLESHPAVERAVASVWEPQPGRKSLAAWVVPATGHNPSSDEMRAHLRDNIPDYMVPSTIATVTEIPLTPNGKVDRDSLPSPQAAERPDTLESPTDEVEEKLLEIWTVELGRERIGVNDNFFELGGDSLRAVKIIARVHDQFHVRPQLARLFTHPSIRALAKCIRELQDESKAEVIPIQESGSRPPLYWVSPSPLIRELSREFGSDQPVFGLATWNWDKRLGDESFDHLCAQQAEALKAHAPGGPVVLGGWCLQGLLAYDTACRCVDDGVPVRAVVLFDTVAPSPPGAGAIPWLARRIRIIWSRFTYHLSRTFRTEPSHRLQYFTDRIRGAAHHARETVDPRPATDRSEILAAAAQKYALPRAPFPVIVVVPEDNLTTRVAGPFLGWSSIADGQLKKVTVPGDHESMFQPPNLKIVAESLREVLDTLNSE